MTTIEDIETLAEGLERDDGARRAKLLRLIRAYARILAQRDPRKFPRRPRELSDEDGHWDNSYPPSLVWKDRTGPRLACIVEFDYQEIATSSGFYHDWRAGTTEPGIYVDHHGALWGATVSGSGSLGAFAAHPGNCDVALEIGWSKRDEDDISTDELRAAESMLRVLIFPFLRTQSEVTS